MPGLLKIAMKICFFFQFDVKPWRLPKYREKIIYAGKKSTMIRKLEGFEFFCPACNVAFAHLYEYQSHLILRERAKPYEEGLRDVAKQIKDSSFDKI